MNGSEFLFGITDLDRREPHVAILGQLAELAQVIHFGPKPDEQFWQALPLIDVLIIRLMRVDKEMLDQAGRLKAVIKAGVGTDHIDVETATRLGIHVVISTGNQFSVAEAAALLMLALSKNLIQLNKRTGVLPSLSGIEMYGKTLGIIGYGRVGQHLQRIAEGLNMKVIVCDPFLPAAVSGSVQSVELDDLLRQSDYVSLHCPLNQDTFHMIGARELALMKTSAFLINTARGSVVDEQALFQALQNKQIAGAGLDVLEQEPTPPEHPLLQLDNVIVTPHRLCRTSESLVRQINNIAASAAQVYHGRVPGESINQSHISVDADRILNRQQAMAAG